MWMLLRYYEHRTTHCSFNGVPFQTRDEKKGGDILEYTRGSVPIHHGDGHFRNAFK